MTLRPSHPTKPRSLRRSVLDKCAAFTRPEEVKAVGLYPFFKETRNSNGAEVEIEGRSRVNMGSNNYLGLSHHPKVLEAANRALTRYGLGCTGSRFLNGTLDLHHQLEERLATLLDKEAALVFSTGYQANLGVVSCLVQRGELLYIDKCDHASIVDGGKMSFGRTKRFEHGDLEQLERLLQRQVESGLVFVDGVFSMEGDIADVPGLVRIARAYGVGLAIDDAHGLGVLGPHGEGTVAHHGCSDGVDLIVGTFSKSLASIGGYAAGDEDVISYLRHKSRPLMFSAALPPASSAGVLAALDLLGEEPERRERLWRLSRRMHEGLEALGFDLGGTQTPILPVYLGSDERTLLYFRELFERGVFTNAVLSPAVPVGTSRLRVSIVATHSEQHIDAALEAFAEVRRVVDES